MPSVRQAIAISRRFLDSGIGVSPRFLTKETRKVAGKLKKMLHDQDSEGIGPCLFRLGIDYKALIRLDAAARPSRIKSGSPTP